MKTVIGLDIGLRNIKIVNLALRGKDIELLKLEYIESSKTSNQYEVIDLLKLMFNELKLKANTPICLSISAEESFFKIISVKSDKKKKLKELIKDELRNNVVFSLEDCIWDYSLLGHKPKEIVNDVLLVAAKNEAVSDKIQLIKELNRPARLINLDILANYNCLKFNTELQKGKLYALVDISSMKTQVLIFDERENFWMRTIIFGGDKFTDVIAEKFGFSENEAREYKKNMLLQENIDAQLKESSDSVMKDLATELDKTFNYYYFQTSESASKKSPRKIDEIFLSGGGSLYFGLDKLLGSLLNIPTRYVYPLNKLSVKDNKLISKKNVLNAQLPQFAIAIGLALQGLAFPGIRINLIKKTGIKPFKKIKLDNLYNFSIVICVVLLMFLGIKIAGVNKQRKLIFSRTKELNAIFQKYMPQLSDLKTVYDKTSAQIKALDTTANNRDMISRSLYKLSEIISKEAWITNYIIKLDYQTSSGELTLTGKSVNYAAINKLISGLKDTGYFKEIKPVSSKIAIDEITKEEVVNFIIKLEIRIT